MLPTRADSAAKRPLPSLGRSGSRCLSASAGPIALTEKAWAMACARISRTLFSGPPNGSSSPPVVTRTRRSGSDVARMRCTMPIQSSSLVTSSGGELLRPNARTAPKHSAALNASAQALPMALREPMTTARPPGGKLSRRDMGPGEQRRTRYAHALASDQNDLEGPADLESGPIDLGATFKLSFFGHGCIRYARGGRGTPPCANETQTCNLVAQKVVGQQTKNS